MVLKLNYYRLRMIEAKNIVRVFVLFLFLFFINQLIAQDSTHYNIVHIDSVNSFSIDRYNNIYLVTDKQDVVHFQKKLNNYSPKKRNKIDHIEAWNSLNLFLFNKEYQEYTLLDKYLTPISTTPFDLDEVGFILFATSAIDGNIWAIDATDFTLKKINIRNNKTIFTTNLNFVIRQDDIDVLFMKERGNFLYVCTRKNGILVFDNMGNYKKKLAFNGVSFLGFRGNEIYFVIDNKLCFFDLLSLKLRKEILSISCSKGIIIENQLYIVK